jgi:hypothetical protein
MVSVDVNQTIWHYTPKDSLFMNTVVRSTTDQIFCIRQILEKKWEYNETVHQLFVDFKKVHDSVERKELYNILIEFGVPTTVFSINITV